ncbi:MAG: WecB/TagA/CpsF family glycosyltransferase [Chloroflexota bacterium]|nr:WecB/TagA/CpsF family glycosyltransferase [Chloroflexota bacterium]
MFASESRPHPAQTLFGVRISVLDVPGTLRAFGRMLVDGGTHQVATVNPEFLVRAQLDREYQAILNRCDLTTVDGIGVALALRLLYRRPVARVTGADLVPELAQVAARQSVPVYLLGGAPGVAARAASELQRRCPELRVAGAQAGSPEPEADEETVSAIASSGARLLLVAFGSPLQERWIARNLGSLPACVAIGVGGTLDYLAGTVPRAPRWMRTAGLEWLYRLYRQPGRWRRQLALPLFAYMVLRALAGRRWPPSRQVPA